MLKRYCVYAAFLVCLPVVPIAIIAVIDIVGILMLLVPGSLCMLVWQTGRIAGDFLWELDYLWPLALVVVSGAFVGGIVVFFRVFKAQTKFIDRHLGIEMDGKCLTIADMDNWL